MPLRDLENKYAMNFRKDSFRNRRDKNNSLGKREAENGQQIASSEYPTQLLCGMACLWLTKIFEYLNKNVSLFQG